MRFITTRKLYALAATALVAVLGALFMQTRVIDFDSNNEILGALRELKQVDAEWNVDVLRAKTGLASDYDRVASPLPQIESLTTALSRKSADIWHDRADSNARMVELLGLYSKLMDRKISMIERFKSQNAILRNSSRFLPIAATDLVEATRASGISGTAKLAIVMALTDLLADTMTYSLTPDESLRDRIGKGTQQLGQLTATLSPEVRARAETLLAHVGTVLRQQEASVRLLAELNALATAKAIDDLSDAHMQERDKLFGEQQIYRQALLAYSVFLLLLLGFAGWRLFRSVAQLRVAATAFESQDGMLIADASNVTVQVNRAFTEITGYASEEVVGQPPHLLQSDRHGPDFYSETWAAIEHTGGWQGEIWGRRKDGDSYSKWLTITAVKSDEGVVTHYVYTETDITARKMAEEEIMRLAFFDPLTQLPNRRLLNDRLIQAMAASNRSGFHGALLFLDLDNFKVLNDTLGHDKGDLLLQQVAQRLVTCVREGDTVARLGGDEFVVMLEGLSGQSEEAATQAETVGEKILAMLNLPYQLADHENRSTPSIGITLLHGHQTSVEELLKQADLAMYQSKTAGRNTLRFFDPAMQALVADRAVLEADLREAVTQQQFVLYYQAQVVGKGRLTGAEALVRWQHPRRGLVSPAEFIPLSEETGLILPLGHWVLEAACAQLAKWAGQPDTAHFYLAVNVSAKQLQQVDFVDQVLAVLDRTGANPKRLKLELTESVLVSNVETTIAKMAALKAKGVGFSLDDFGTGYSSLAYLKRLPLDQLKIDQGFVRDILIDPNDAAIARMVIVLAESMGLTVIAEGVESEAQRDFLARMGCHAYQGYLFSRPLPLDEFAAFAKRVDGQ
jgi:diguanylate cyclase (GGDEF)-like protein/PAS domain S-box-containing protein